MCCVNIPEYGLGIPQHRPFSCGSYICHGEICHEILHHNIHKLCLAFTMLIHAYNQHMSLISLNIDIITYNLHKMALLFMALHTI